MISILPLNIIKNAFLVIKPIRYFWELSLPRRQLNRPPVLSSCWLIYSAALKKLGGFKAARKDIVPEAYFAKSLIKMNDGYSFLRSSTSLGLTSAKPLSEQSATAIRTRYPQLHRRPEMVLLAATAELFFFIAPFVIALSGYSYSLGVTGESLAIAASLALIVNNILLVKFTFPGHIWQSLISWPVAVATDVGLLVYSMYKYEFSTVIWKDRNVCQPVMQVIKQLPPI